jgi:hypothetical protein
MHSTYRRLAVFALLSCASVLAGACKRSASTSPSTSASTNRNMLTRSQIDQRYNTVYEAVEALRSNWLNTRGADSFNNPSVVRVYLDNVSLGDKETLRTIAVSSISYVRWFDGVTATSRWGLNHGAGVIYVSTRPAGVGDPLH